jgi:hypothetical protein
MDRTTERSFGDKTHALAEVMINAVSTTSGHSLPVTSKANRQMREFEAH